MNVIFITMSRLKDVSAKDIYADLMRKFKAEGHSVYVVSPCERRMHLPTQMLEQDGVKILRVKTLNVVKTNPIEKGIGQILLERQFKKAISKYFGNTKFDLILYSTPPVTFPGVVKSLKQKNPEAVTYLLLKDIFPQNAVDLGMMSKKGIKGILYKYFRRKEIQTYQFSDYIGCMSPANIKYLLEHNSYIDPARVEVAPNSYDWVEEPQMTQENKVKTRNQYGLPLDVPIFVYGGNLGKPQGIPFLIECLQACKDRKDCHFVVVGDGTEYPKIEQWYKETKPQCVSLFQRLPKADYDNLVRSCDVGLIFLDYRFTIPNYPSRLLPYLMEKKPILAATDRATDIGVLAETNGYGVACYSNDVNSFVEALNKMLASPDAIAKMGENGFRFCKENYRIENTYNAIMNHIKNV